MNDKITVRSMGNAIPVSSVMVDDDIIGPVIWSAIDRSVKTTMGIPWMREKPKGYYWSVLHEHRQPGLGYPFERFL